MYSLVIPVYKNEASIPRLIEALQTMNKVLENHLDVTFVVDGSPDHSYALLKQSLPSASFHGNLLLLSRNFGAYAAIRAGLEVAKGPFFAVMAADLQEPPELIIQIFKSLTTEPVDIAFGIREGREDPWHQKIPAKLFWRFYKMVQKEMPSGGVDIFGCNLQFRNQLLMLEELNSSLVGLAIWLGFRRKLITYRRLKREQGKSQWSIRKKIKYATDSLFSFSDLPIKFLYLIGTLGIGLSIFSAISVLFAKLSGTIPVPGYAATLITIVFFAALNAMGLGVVGSYVWRAFENTKLRPQSIVMSSLEFNAQKTTLGS
jgi:glycosyltransferase involved in cell wall biosynthesis